MLKFPQRKSERKEGEKKGKERKGVRKERGRKKEKGKGIEWGGLLGKEKKLCKKQ